MEAMPNEEILEKINVMRKQIENYNASRLEGSSFEEQKVTYLRSAETSEVSDRNAGFSNQDDILRLSVQKHTAQHKLEKRALDPDDRYNQRRRPNDRSSNKKSSLQP